MKLIHLSDLHLGKSLNEFDLIDDQRYILDQILGLVDEHEVDGVLIAGDVYDKSIPSEAAVNLLDDFLSRLSDKNIPVFMISGNHDSDDRLNFGSRLFMARGIHIAARYRGELAKETLTVGEQEVDIWLLPFVKASHVRAFFPDETIETYEDAVRVVLSHAEIDPDRCNILVAHQFVVGSGDQAPEFGGSESVGTRSVGTVERIGYDVFDAFDYVALGHIHRPQRIGRDTVRYAGSPLKYSLSEESHTKTAPLITIEPDGTVRYDLLPLTPMRDMRHLRGRLSDLLDPKHVSDPEDFIYATLTDDEVIDDVMAILQQTYKNTVKIDYDNAHAGAEETVDITTVAADRPFEEWVGEFYQKMYGTDITDEEMAILREVAGEAGAIDETD